MVAPIILADADNTLWDTDTVFADAQRGLLGAVEASVGLKCVAEDRLAFIRGFDQAIAAKHHAHLKYPPTLLVWALVLGLKGAATEMASAAVLRGHMPFEFITHATVDSVVQDYFAMLGAVPTLLPTVLDGLMQLRTAGLQVYVLTEGKIEKQKAILAQHSMEGLVGPVFEVPKNVAQFERLRQRFAPAEVIVIGDQPDRDITPAKQAGCTTVLVPSRFRPQWHDVQAFSDAGVVASTFSEGVRWILEREAAVTE